MENSDKITIIDIAERANVSPSTVSRVLRGSAGVTDRKKTAVINAVNDLNYRPNIFAQSLASGQSMTIGVLTQNFGSPFYDGILQGILVGLENTNYWPIFADGRWQVDVEEHALQTLIDRQIDGLILVGGQMEEVALQRLAQQKPLIVAAREVASLPANCLFVDNFSASYKITEYLLERGHRHIAHITAPVNYGRYVTDIDKRREGYEQALRDAGITPNPQLVVEGSLQQQSGVLAVEMLLTRGQHFSAIFAANDQMAFGARLALYRRGIRVPDEISLVGFDDEPSAAYMVPPLTTVSQPAIQMGRDAAKAILELIAGKNPAPSPYQADLVIRESVARH